VVGKCSYVFGEVDLVSGLVRRSRIIVGTFSARSAFCRNVFDEVGFVPVRVRRSRLIVGTCSAWSF